MARPSFASGQMMKQPSGRRFRVPSERFFAVPNEAFEWFNILTPKESLVYISIFRLTYGYGKLLDTIALSQLVGCTNIPRRSIDRILSTLRSHGLLKMTGPARHPKTFKPTPIAPPGDATAMAPPENPVAPTIGVTVTPQLWRTSKYRERDKLALVK